MLTPPPQWRLPLLALLAAWALLAAIYADTGASMVLIWNRSETFAHAWVVPPLSAWMVWRLRAELALLTPRPAPRWLWLIVPVGLLWLLGDLAVANAATQFAFVGMVVLMVPALLGTEVARRIAFPLGFLFFAVPFGDFLTPWLVDRTADFTVMALRATGIPVFREGTEFVIPTGSWSVVQACSGIRYLMASVMVGTLFAYLNYRSYRRRWAFVGVAIVTPLVANWLRAYMIVMLGHLSGNKLAVGADHIIYGWVFFGIIMLVMFMVGARWSEPDAPAEPAPAAATTDQSAPRRWGLALLGAALLLAAPWMLRSQAEHAVIRGEPAVTAPALAAWTWRNEPMTSWHPFFQGPAAVLHGRYEPDAGGPAVGVYVGYYRDQKYGRQLVTSVNRFVDGEAEKDWSQTASGGAVLDLPAGAMPWRTGELRGQALAQVSGDGSRAPRLRVWQTYWINGRPFVSDWQAKLYGALQRMLGRGDDAAVVLVYVDKAAAGAEDALLKDFLRTHWGALDTALRGVRDRDAARQQ